MRTATITFHASHNYGSMLQAYALQQVIVGLGHQNEIINLRTARQKHIYQKPSLREAIKGPVRLYRYLLKLPYLGALQRKYDLFEQFLRENMTLTREFASMEEIEKAELDYDVFISGSDQIWNTLLGDFDWSFYLPFAGLSKRISYAVSMGSNAERQEVNKDRIQILLSHYSHVSVREFGTAAFVRKYAQREAVIDLDPTLLLPAAEWRKKIGRERIIRDKYILLYCPKYSKEVYSVARYLSRVFGMPVVDTQYRSEAYFSGCVRRFDVGPIEFLNLMENAEIVVGSSYHMLIFSLLFHRPFWSVGGERDNRTAHLLKATGLMQRCASVEDIAAKYKNTFAVDFDKADEYLSEQREKSIAHLKEMI